MEIDGLSNNRVGLSFQDPTEAYWFARAGMTGHPIQAGKLRLQAIWADPNNTADKPLRVVLPRTSLALSQWALAAEVKAQDQLDETTRVIAGLLKGMHEGIGAYLSGE